jgi:hypothetical protein
MNLTGLEVRRPRCHSRGRCRWEAPTTQELMVGAGEVTARPAQQG